MRTILNMIVLLLSLSAHAKVRDKWFCVEDAGQVSYDEGSMELCGMGYGSTEGEARAKALDQATSDYKKLCELSDECQSRSMFVIPKRTSCEESQGSWTCYRMLSFRFGEIGSHQATVKEKAPHAYSAEYKLGRQKGWEEVYSSGWHD